MENTKDSLFGKTLSELQEIVIELNFPKFTAKQIADWLYKKTISTIDEMTNLPKKLREILSEKYNLGLHKPIKVESSADGTKKYLYNSVNNKYIETAFIPEDDRATLCVSSQIGCKMGCLFCMTAKQGFQGNLSAGEIINQIHSLPEKDKLTNVVYMGMGEPFDNLTEVLKSLEILTSEWGYAWSPTRITVSSIGIVPAMQHFIEKSNAHLAISLHSPFDEERKKLMPIQNVFPIESVIEEIRKSEIKGQRRISFEYIVFHGINHSFLHVKELARLLNGLSCRINLIKFHSIPGTPLQEATDEEILKFKNELNKKGILSTIRRSRGEDILAACGLLSTKELNKAF